MDQRARRIEFLQQQIDFLTTQKKRLMVLANFTEGRKSREKWAERLDFTIEKLQKFTSELAALEQESN